MAISKTWLFSTSVGLLVGLAACQSPQSQVPELNPPKPKVVAAANVLCDLVQQIAQEQVDLTCLIAPGVDPHTYKLTPTDAQAIATADLILYSGYNFEEGLTKSLRNPELKTPQIAVSELAVPQPLIAAAHDHGDHEGEHDHSTEKAPKEGVPDPHVWHNPQHGIKMATVVEQELAKLLPAAQPEFSQNRQTLTIKLSELDQWIKTQVATIPANQRQVVTTHQSLGYFAAAYGLKINPVFVGISGEQKPSAARVAELVEQIKDTKVPTIFVETNVNPQLIQTIAQEAQVKVADTPLFGDGLGQPGSQGATYTEMLISNTRTLVEGLGGKYTQPSTGSAS
ncbi:MAG: metal ABC transporter substrate-binding protein [Pseudanabaenaceae cyanobacterium bins.68]|nr:metal ABC transporter substrate-binding protein [Pseudanabaenaceae cyanobacterium bins.68]